MNNTGETISIFVSVLCAIIPMIMPWIGKKFKCSSNQYAIQKYLFCNYAIYSRIMFKIIINSILLAIIIITSMAIGVVLKAFPFGLNYWLMIYGFAYVLQVIIIGKGYYGLDRHGNRKNYKFSICLFVATLDIILLTVVMNNQKEYVLIGYIIEIILVLLFTYYIINIQKVKYCECVILFLKHNESKKVAIEDLQLEGDGSVTIYNQNRSSVQINSNLINEKKAIYSDEYIQWTDKIHDLNREEKMKKKNNKDIWWSMVILFGILPVAISIIDIMDLAIYENIGIRNWINLIVSNDNMVSDLFSQQMTISAILISVTSLVVSNINDRFMGASTKYILFRRSVLCFNYITIILILLALNVSSFAAYLLQSKWGLIISFVISMIWLFMLMKLTYYLLSKKSKIYSIISKRLEVELNKKQDFVIYNVLLDKLDALIEKKDISTEKIHDSYFVEEMLVLYKMKSIADICGGKDHYVIDKAKMFYINRDERGGEKLEKLFDHYKGEEYKKTLDWIRTDLKRIVK